MIAIGVIYRPHLWKPLKSTAPTPFETTVMDSTTAADLYKVNTTLFFTQKAIILSGRDFLNSRELQPYPDLPVLAFPFLAWPLPSSSPNRTKYRSALSTSRCLTGISGSSEFKLATARCTS